MEHLILNGLNEEQKKVVEEIDRNILLLASAGTGKTNTLSKRISNIIAKEKAKEDEILSMTFTNRACKEMKDRIIAELGRGGMDIHVKTFHSFCFDVIKEECKKNTDVHFDFIIYDEDDCKEIINENNIEKFSVTAIQNFINYIKEKSITYVNHSYEEIMNNLVKYNYNKLKEICIDGSYKTDYNMLNYLIEYGSLIIKNYDSILQERHGMDFNDLIIKVYSIFSKNEIVERWRKKFKYILIDEVQDTSSTEYNIIKKLFYGNNVMMCGDYFQTIYEWRGSQPKEILKDFNLNFSPVQIVFNENYRASETLLKASYGYLKNSFLEDADKIYEKEIEPRSGFKGEKITVKKSKTLEEEAYFIFNKIKELKVENLSKVAVLTRNNKLNNQLSETFTLLNSRLQSEERISFLLIDEFKFFRRQEIKDIISYLKLVNNKLDNNSLKRVLKRFAKGVGEGTIESIESGEFFKLGVRLTDLIDKNTHTYGEPYQLLINELYKGNVVVFDVESTGINTTEDEIVQISAVRINHKGEVLDTFERFLKTSRKVGQSQFVHGFSDEFLNAKGEDSRRALKDFLNFSKDTLIVGHNVSYDISILTSQLSRLCMDRFEFIDYYDTLDISRRFYPSFENHKLETLSKIFNTSTKSSHNAMDDVLATKDVLINMLKEKVIPTVMNRMTIYEKYLNKFSTICNQIDQLRQLSYEKRPCDLIADIVNISNIKKVYEKELSRVNNVREMYLICKDKDDLNISPRDALQEFLKLSSLSNSELDRMLKKHPRVPIITIHQAKGSEFDYVFMAGLEDYVFPSYKSIKDENLEEEKRVFYVGITRSKKELFLTFAENEGRKVREESRLIEYIPKEYINRV